MQGKLFKVLPLGAALIAVLILTGCATNQAATPSPSASQTAEEVEVPDVTGFGEAQAVAAIESLGLLPVVIRDYTGHTPEGLVDGVQDPGILVKVAKGTRVVIVVSKGQNPVTLPTDNSDNENVETLSLKFVSGYCGPGPVPIKGKSVCTETFEVENLSNLPVRVTCRVFITASSKVYADTISEDLKIDMNPNDVQVVNAFFIVPSGDSLENLFISDTPDITKAVASIWLKGRT